MLCIRCSRSTRAWTRVPPDGLSHHNAPPFDGQDFQTNLIMPEPTIFLSRKFPVCSIIRPSETKGAAMGALKFLTDMGLFIGQSPEFFAELKQLAQAADPALRIPVLLRISLQLFLL